jgi:ABC-type Fe3+-hydroxamate transport system substrate-binding protein
VSGSLLLVMLFVDRPSEGHDLMSVMRQTLAYSAGGIFMSVALVARRVDRAVKAEAVEAAYQAQLASATARHP